MIVTSAAKNSGEALTAVVTAESSVLTSVSTAAETTKATTKANEKTTKKTAEKTTEAISEAEESGTATVEVTKAEEDTASMNRYLFSLCWVYNNVEYYPSAPVESLLYLYQEEFPLETISAGYCDNTSGAAPAEPLNKAAYDLFCDYLEPLRDKINKYFEENKNKAVEKFKSGADYDWTDVTDWFPETITITGENGTYICNISNVEMTVGSCNATGDSMENQYFISDKYLNGDNYVYAGTVDFSFSGYIE